MIKIPPLNVKVAFVKIISSLMVLVMMSKYDQDTLVLCIFCKVEGSTRSRDVLVKVVLLKSSKHALTPILMKQLLSR